MHVPLGKVLSYHDVPSASANISFSVPVKVFSAEKQNKTRKGGRRNEQGKWSRNCERMYSKTNRQNEKQQSETRKFRVYSEPITPWLVYHLNRDKIENVSPHCFSPKISVSSAFVIFTPSSVLRISLFLKMLPVGRPVETSGSSDPS